MTNAELFAWMQSMINLAHAAEQADRYLFAYKYAVNADRIAMKLLEILDHEDPLRSNVIMAHIPIHEIELRNGRKLGIIKPQTDA